MARFGKISKERLKMAHPDLQKIANELILLIDVSILCSIRSESEQNAAYNSGASQLKWPESKHNVSPSMAIDVVPYPLDWQNIDRFKEMCLLIESIAHINNIKIRLGRDFSFKDYPHVELINEEKRSLESKTNYLDEIPSDEALESILEGIERDILDD